MGGESHQPAVAADDLEFLLSGEDKVPLSSIGQKTTCIFFTAKWCRPCRNFTPLLVELYSSINATGKRLEIILVSSDRDESSFREHYKGMPWLAAPFNSDLWKRMRLRCSIGRIPALIPISPDEKTVGDDAVQLVEDYGVDAFPFDAQRREELKAMDDAKRRGGSLLDLLGSSTRDYVVTKDKSKVHIRDFAGKTVGLYFGANWCPPCRTFTSMLVEVHSELRYPKHSAFEIIFISMDRDEQEFQLGMEGMPWPAIPYSDKARRDLVRIFKITGIPTLVLLGPDGKAIGTDGKAMISSYGARAFPFTVARAAEVEAALRKEGEELPRSVVFGRHPHVLKLDMARAYVCDSCGRRGSFWVFSCDKCDFDLHPACARE